MTNPYFLSKGSHTTAGDGRCAMEWVADRMLPTVPIRLPVAVDADAICVVFA